MINDDFYVIDNFFGIYTCRSFKSTAQLRFERLSSNSEYQKSLITQTDILYSRTAGLLNSSNRVTMFV